MLQEGEPGGEGEFQQTGQEDVPEGLPEAVNRIPEKSKAETLADEIQGEREKIVKNGPENKIYTIAAIDLGGQQTQAEVVQELGIDLHRDQPVGGNIDPKFPISGTSPPQTGRPGLEKTEIFSVQEKTGEHKGILVLAERPSGDFDSRNLTRARTTLKPWAIIALHPGELKKYIDPESNRLSNDVLPKLMEAVSKASLRGAQKNRETQI